MKRTIRRYRRRLARSWIRWTGEASFRLYLLRSRRRWKRLMRELRGLGRTLKEGQP